MDQVLSELPEGWEWSVLSEQTIPTKNIKPASTPDQQFTYIDISAIDRNINKIVDLKIIVGSEAPSRAKKEVCANDVLFATTRPNLKNVAVFDGGIESPVASTGFCVLRSSGSMDAHFLFYFLTTEFLQQQIAPHISGAQYPAITDKNLKRTPIPLPPLNEQKRIVAKLDALFTRIDTAITHLQQTLELSKALFASAQQSIFDGLEHTHQVVSLDDVCTITSSKRIFKSDYINDGVPFFRTKEIVELSRNKSISTELFISDEKFEQIDVKFGVPKEGDLLFSAVGTIGVTWMVDNRKFYFKDGNLLWLKDFDGIDVAFLRESIAAVLAEKIRSKSQGAAYKAISIRNLKSFRIPLPSIERQKCIVTHLNALSEHTRAIDAATEEKLNNLNTLKASLLDAAFKGQL